LKLSGEEHWDTCVAANNLAVTLLRMKRYKEAKSVLRKTIPVARRVLSESTDLVHALRWNYAQTLYLDADATLDDLCEAVETLEDTERIARRVLGGAHPIVVGIEKSMREARAALRARETPQATE
jgi:hypothetical protein